MPDPAAEGLSACELELLQYAPEPATIVDPLRLDFRTARALPGALCEEKVGVGRQAGRRYLHVAYDGPARSRDGAIVERFAAIYPEAGGPPKLTAHGHHPRQKFLTHAATWRTLSERARQAVLAVHEALGSPPPRDSGLPYTGANSINYVLLGQFLDGASAAPVSSAIGQYLHEQTGLERWSDEARTVILDRFAPEAPAFRR